MLAHLLLYHLALPVAWACKLTLRIRRTAQEFAVLAESVHQRLLAFWTRILARCHFCLRVFHIRYRCLKVLLEWPVELRQNAHPLEVLLFYLIKLLFHISCKRYVHYLREIFVELLRNYLTQIRRKEFLLVLLDVVAILYSTYNRRVRTRPAYPLLLQCLHQ